jgi:hypothetical protein
MVGTCGLNMDHMIATGLQGVEDDRQRFDGSFVDVMEQKHALTLRFKTA